MPVSGAFFEFEFIISRCLYPRDIALGVFNFHNRKVKSIIWRMSYHYVKKQKLIRTLEATTVRLLVWWEGWVLESGWPLLGSWFFSKLWKHFVVSLTSIPWLIYEKDNLFCRDERIEIMHGYHLVYNYTWLYYIWQLWAVIIISSIPRYGLDQNMRY